MNLSDFVSICLFWTWCGTKFQTGWDRDNKRQGKLWNAQKHLCGTFQTVSLLVTGDPTCHNGYETFLLISSNLFKSRSVSKLDSFGACNVDYITYCASFVFFYMCWLIVRALWLAVPSAQTSASFFLVYSQFINNKVISADRKLNGRFAQ